MSAVPHSGRAPSAARVLAETAAWAALGLAALLMLALVLLGAAAAAEPVAPEAARRFIDAMGNRAVAALALQNDRRRRDDAFTGVMVDAIDFDTLATATLGRMARTARAADKTEFNQLFAAHVIDVAIERFGDTQVSRFTIGEIRQQPNGDVKVNTLIDRANDKPLSVDWRVRNAGGAPRINDIEVEGYSLAIHYRGEFERAGVSTVPGLIQRLKEMTKHSAALATVRKSVR